VNAEVTYAGLQPQYSGLDQVNVVIPQSLRGRGVVNVVLEQSGLRANTVTIQVK
jgi:uncharacterized protein (TIGR03437 family)